MIEQDFLETHHAHISFSKKGKMYLEPNESDAEPIENIVILKEPPQEETNHKTGYLLQDISVDLWALFSTDTTYSIINYSCGLPILFSNRFM